MSNLTSILASDIVSASRTTINTNFGSLNTGKLEAPINASVIGDGTVSNTEFGYLDGVTSAIQTQINARATTSTLTGSYSTTSTISGTYTTLPINASTISVGQVTNTVFNYLAGISSSVVSIDNIQSLSNKTLVTPSVASFAQAQHTHADGAGGGQLNASSVFTMTGGQIKTSVLGTGTASNTTYLRGDSTWATIAGGGDVSKVGTPVNNQVGVWTGDGTIEGDAALTFDTATDNLATSIMTASTSIELGHASDTTLTRVSAGVIAIEGVTVATSSNALTLTNKTLTSPSIATAALSGTQLLAEGASIGLDPVASADGAYSGITITATSGYAQAFGDLVYLDPTDSRWEAVDANAASGADGDARGTMGMVVVAGTDGNACTILLQGVIRADANFPALTINAPVYASETAGDIVVAQPTTTDAVIRVVGFALTADSIYFNPSPDYITHT